MTTIEPQRPTRDEVRDLVKECGLDWQRGFTPLFDGDDMNRYEVLVRAAIEQYAAERVAEARNPLNFDQLQGVISAHFGSHELTDDENDSAEAFARAIERAHGIGIGEQQNG